MPVTTTKAVQRFVSDASREKKEQIALGIMKMERDGICACTNPGSTVIKDGGGGEI